MKFIYKTFTITIILPNLKVNSDRPRPHSAFQSWSLKNSDSVENWEEIKDALNKRRKR